MERLTDRIKGVVVYIGTRNTFATGQVPSEVGPAGVREMMGRLAAYEDTGFVPEDLSATCSPDTLLRVIARAYNVKIGDLREAVLALKEGRYIIMRDAEQEGVARMRELGKADKDGRVAILPAEDYCWNIRGDLMLGIITANCRAAKKSLEAMDHA